MHIQINMYMYVYVYIYIQIYIYIYMPYALSSVVEGGALKSMWEQYEVLFDVEAQSHRAYFA